MKLAAREAAALLAKPDRNSAAFLLYGQNEARIDRFRADLTRAIAGPQGEEDMRITRIAAGALRKDAALLLDSLKAVSFFPGPRVTVVEDAGDGLAPSILAALAERGPEDAALIVTAGSLTKASALRKGFEDHRAAQAVAFYDDPLSREEIQQVLKSAGVGHLSREAGEALESLAAEMDVASLAALAEKLALYKLGDGTDVSLAEIESLAVPAEAEVDTTLALMMEGQVVPLAQRLRRQFAQGTSPVSLVIAASQMFRQMHKIKADPQGVSSAIARQRPPLFGPKRDRLERQVKAWPMELIEQALDALVATDLKLRSSSKVPDFALVERTLLRISLRRK